MVRKMNTLRTARRVCILRTFVSHTFHIVFAANTSAITLQCALWSNRVGAL
ncbi:MAG: hypothetical protein ACI8R4_003079, partial [Paracoccaceae bacterium]